MRAGGRVGDHRSASEAFLQAGDMCHQKQRYDDSIAFYSRAQQEAGTGQLVGHIVTALQRYVLRAAGSSSSCCK